MCAGTTVAFLHVDGTPSEALDGALTEFSHSGLASTLLPEERTTRSGRSARTRSCGPSPGRRGGRLLTLEAPRLQARQERIPVHAQAARGAALVPVLALQGAQHEGLLEAVARLAERERARLALSARRRSSSPITGRVARATLRSMMFSSSRPLPGQS